MKDFLNKWYYVKNPDGGFIFLKYLGMKIGGKEILKQVLLSENKMMNGVYLIDDYKLEKNKQYTLTLKSYDILIFGDSKEMLKEQLVRENYVTNDEFDLYYSAKEIPYGTEEIIFQQ